MTDRKAKAKAAWTKTKPPMNRYIQIWYRQTEGGFRNEGLFKWLDMDNTYVEHPGDVDSIALYPSKYEILGWREA